MTILTTWQNNFKKTYKVGFNLCRRKIRMSRFFQCSIKKLGVLNVLDIDNYLMNYLAVDGLVKLNQSRNTKSF